MFKKNRPFNLKRIGKSANRGEPSVLRRTTIAMLEWLYPTNCRLCDRPISDAPPMVFRRKNAFESLICVDCRKKLLAPTRLFCRRCGRPVCWERDVGDDVLCAACRRGNAPPTSFDELRPGNFYRGLTRTFILRLKRERDATLAEAFGRLYFASRRRVLTKFAPDFVVPVPMNWRRRLLRGVNSPDFFAAALADELGVPLLSKTVRRVRSTPPQSSVDWDSRRRNVAGAFRLIESRSFSIATLRDKRILLVDDVFTSGATANEISKLLKDSGVLAVCVATFGRAGLGKRRRSK